ncbi:MAG: TatD family hydrolase, partial [Pseudoalteromonas spongiae]
GFYLSMSGVTTFKNADGLRAIFRKTPLERILLETDAPSMPLYGFQGERNTPSQITRVFDELCELKGIETQSARIMLAEQLYSSSCSVLRI